jgi:IMP and pyridine-specific 5'-nucleotidase
MGGLGHPKHIKVKRINYLQQIVELMGSIVLMSHNTKIGIVTAAGYTEARRYYERLHGLLEAVRTSTMLTMEQKHNLIVMGKSS